MKNKTQTKIIFLFNQLLTPELITGGEIRAKILLDYFSRDPDFQTQVITPKLSANNFKPYPYHLVGLHNLETKVNPEKSFSSFILYFLRTLELIKIKSQIKTDILYSTGDFFCDIIPSVFIKKKYPKTKLVAVIHHINTHPFKRNTTSFLAGLISYLLQRFDFYLIRKHYDLIFVVNHQVKDYLVQHHFCQPIITSYNGLFINQIKKDFAQVENKPQSNHICYFGRVTASKGSLDLPIILSNIKKKVPDIHLDIIGSISPNIKTPLIQKFKDYNCQKNYTLHGFIQNKLNVYSIMKKSKVIIFPSYEEGWGISLFESIMSRRPVVAYNLPVFKEVFHHRLITAPIANTTEFSVKTINLIKKFSHHSTQRYINKCYQIAQKLDWQNTFNIEQKSINQLLSHR